MRILVCGGRKFADYTLLRRTLDALCGVLCPPPDQIGTWLPPGTVLIHRRSTRADSLADRWATVKYVKTEVFDADWDRFGRRAGPLRNQRMLDEGKPTSSSRSPAATERPAW
jgi:hypothetical protein